MYRVLRQIFRRALPGVLCLFGVAAHSDLPEAATLEFFELKVRPVLAEHCYPCHGPEKQKSGLRLDSAEGLLTGAEKGAPVVPGHPDQSLMIQVVRRTGELKMPPEDPLAPEDIAALEAWIAAGATIPAEFNAPPPADVLEKGKTHWAYQPIQDHTPPPVVDTSWPRNGLDRFTLALMEARGLQPAAQVDKRTLLRRVTFDLTGLPPTPQETQSFLEDTAPDAYARVVDRLLASPQFGERWARHWLDVVRYTDSFDSRASVLTDPAEIWRYRDWVVESLNRDLPYDQFLKLQIAGDLFPAPDGGFNRDGLIATGVLAIGNWPQGDADKQKMVADIVDDQIDLVMRGFLSTTMGCARCHDHKFDPFTMRDYYALAGIFFSSSILPGPGQKTEGSPILHLPLASRAELEARKAHDEKLAALRAERESLIKEDRMRWASHEAEKTAQYLLAVAGVTQDIGNLNTEALQRWAWYLGLGGYKTLSIVGKDIFGMPGLFSRNGGTDLPSAVANTGENEVRFATITQPAKSLSIHPSPSSPVSVAWRSPLAGMVDMEIRVADADEKCGNGVQWVLEKRSRGTTQELARGDVPNGMASMHKEAGTAPVETGDFLILRILPNGDHSCDTTRVSWVLVSDTGGRWDLEEEVLPVFVEGNPWPDAQGNTDVWWLFDDGAQAKPNEKLFAPYFTALKTGQTASGTAGIEVAARLLQVAILASREKSGSIFAEITGENGPYWIASPPPQPGTRMETLETELAQAEAEQFPPLDLAVGIQEGGVPTTEHEGIHDVRIHKRGSYTNLGDMVPRRMPLWLAGDDQPPITEGSGRLQLAEWVASPRNPLTARVMVNHIWQHHFGDGIVRTPGDFGAQGERPTHPELLDWLARRFIESGWSLKAIHRIILLSATYQQSVGASAEALATDPENRYFSHANRRRIDAEELRDSVLAVSGRLNLSPGGPAYTDFNTPRRTLYLRCNRSDRTTYTMLFDAADPTSIIPRRVESTVAPQALFLMNHPFVLSEAATLAQRIATLFNTPEAQINALCELLFTRPCTPQEQDLARSFLQDAPIPEADRMAAYIQTLLCSNEFMFVD